MKSLLKINVTVFHARVKSTLWVQIRFEKSNIDFIN